MNVVHILFGMVCILSAGGFADGWWGAGDAACGVVLVWPCGGLLSGYVGVGAGDRVLVVLWA